MKKLQLFFLPAIALLFISCENFLDGGDVKEEIERAIYIANHQCPEATVEPAFSETGLARNRAIIVNFSMPVNPQTFNSSYDIKDENGKSLLEHFMSPLWSKDNKRVTIYANELNLIEVEEDTTLDLYFTLSKACTTDDKLPIQNAINHQYRINSSMDNVPPVMAVSKVQRSKIQLGETILSEPLTLIEGAITDNNEAEIYQTNHINSKIDFYIEGSDFGGGPVTACITYSRINEPDGNKISNPEEKTFLQALEPITDSENSSANFNLDLSLEDGCLDGLYKISLSILDQYGLKSKETKEYYVIRDTQLSKSSNAMFWFETPMYRQDWEEDKEWWYPSPYDQQVPTEANMEHCRRQIRFNYLVDDVYYISPDSTQYIDKVEDFKYLISWGSSLDKLCEPVEMDEEYYEKSINYYLQFDSKNLETYKDNPSGIIPETDPGLKGKKDGQEEIVIGFKENGDPIIPEGYNVTYDSWLKRYYYNNFGGGDSGSIYYTNSLIKYNLPDQFYPDSLANKDKDIYVQTTIIDSVGNVNTIESVIPKAPQVYSYKVEEGSESNKKKITINYSDSTGGVTRFTNVPNKQVDAFYRVFYAQTNDQYADTSNLELIRNTMKEFKDDNWSNFTDKNEFEIEYDANNKYVVVYIQPNYQTHSLVNEVYTGQTFGPFTKVVIDTSVNTSTTNGPAVPVIESVTRESAGPNTGLLNITLTLSSYEAESTYVPYYSKDPKSIFGPEDYIAVNDCTVTSDGKIKFTIANPLRPPVYKDEGEHSLANYVSNTGDPKWDNTWDQWRDTLSTGDYDFTYNVKFKVLATKDGISEESAPFELQLKSLEDDNIPPRQSSCILSHDSRLDFDGKSFIFDGLIIEGEGHLKPYFTYYYTNYNGIWGDNLNVLSPEEIETLPSGKGEYYFNGFVEEGWEGADNAFHFSYSPVVPVTGIEDGSYMFFAKVEDTQGNYAYITLGKAHVGTFINKPQVTANVEQQSIKADFTLAAGEELEKTYISIQFHEPWDNENKGKWEYLYYSQNQLQKLSFSNSRASITYSPDFEYFKELKDKKNTAVKIKDSEDGSVAYTNDQGPVLRKDDPRPFFGRFYRLSVQGFNTHPYDEASGTGVCINYGRPYVDIGADGKFEQVYRTDWGYNQTEYDLCTEETVSYTTYVYLPGDGEDLSDIRSSFSTSDATVISNKKYIVNVLCSPVDLGSNADEWERRGKLIRTHYYEPDSHFYYWYINENENEVNPYYHPEVDPTVHPFNFSVALQDLFDSSEKGQLYYAAVVHFANNFYEVSEVKSAVLF